MIETETVMIVDDEKDTLFVVTESLKKSGIKVHGFDNPLQALDHIVSGCRNCWLLVSDVRMPQMTGFELVKKLRRLRPDFVVLLMSAFEIKKDEFDSVLPSTKVDGFVTKPAKMWTLIETIKGYESMRQKVGACLP